MKRNLTRSESVVWFLAGLVIVGVGGYGIFSSLLLGWVVLGIGFFTVFEGLSGWSLMKAIVRY